MKLVSASLANRASLGRNTPTHQLRRGGSTSSTGAAPTHRNVLRLLQGDQIDDSGHIPTDTEHKQGIDHETQQCIADTLPAKGDETETEDQGPELRLERLATESGQESKRWRRALAKLDEINPREWAEIGV